MLLAAQPVILGPLRFQLVDQNADWIQQGGLYTATGEVVIGLDGTIFQSLLLVESGISIDTTETQQSFTINATPTAHNSLSYFPNGSLTQLTKLWEFQNSYEFENDDLTNLVSLDPKATPVPVTVAGTAVLPIGDEDGLKIANMASAGGGGILVPSSLYITQSDDALKIPQLKLAGRMSLNFASPRLANLLEDVHVSFGDSGTYAVTADAAGLVELGSKTGEGVWVNLTNDEAAKLNGSIVGTTIQWVSMGFMWEQSAKQLSLYGTWQVSLKDDDPSTTTPFNVSLGNQTDPGLQIDFSAGKLTQLQAAFVPGTSNGNSRSSFSFAGGAVTVSLGGLFLRYSQKQDQVGVGGSATMVFGKDTDASGNPANSVSLSLGLPTEDEAGLIIQNGAVQSFDGEFTGSFTAGGFNLRGDVTVNYEAAQPGEDHKAVAAGFLTSPEALGRQVGRYYVALLGRPGDEAGLQYWRDKLLAGSMSADQVAEAFLASDEFLSKALAVGSTPAEKYVRVLYGTTLGRDATPAEVAHWVRILDAGTSRLQVARGFWESAEHRGRQVDQLYADFLNRAPDAPGRARWVDALLGGVTEAEVAAVFLASPEYRAGFDRPSDYLRGLYVDVLGRVAEGNGLAAWQVQGDAGHDSFVSLSGSLAVSYADFTAGVVLPGAGLVLQDGDWLVEGGVGITLNGGITKIKGFQFSFDNLSAVWTKPPKPGQPGQPKQFDSVWTFTGGVVLSSFFRAEVDLTGNGLIIKNGNWDFEGISIHVANLTAGGYGLKDFLLEYQKTNDGLDYEVKTEATLALGFIQVGVEFDYDDGKLASIGADFKAQGEDPGLPVGETGLFISEIGFEVDNLDNLSQWSFEGTVAVAYGEAIQFEGQTVRLFTAEGSFKADGSEFVIENADFNLMNGYLAKGTGSLSLNWVKHQYNVQLDVAGFDGILEVKADFDLNQFNQVTVFADIGVNVPNGVPFIGGMRLADLEGLLYIDPVEKSNDLVAAWIDVNLLITHFRLGAEFRFFPAPGQDSFQILWGDQVEQLEQQATSHENGYQTTFTPTVAGSGTLPPNQSLFTLEWDSTNEIGDVAITIPGVTDPVTIPQDAWGQTSPSPVPFTYQGNSYVVQPIKEITGQRRVAWLIAPDSTGNLANALLPLPVGQYTVVFTTAEALSGKLTHSEAFAPPEVTGVTLTQSANSNQVAVQAKYQTADPANTTIDFYYTTDPKGGSGTLLQGKSITLGSDDPTIGTVQTTVDLTDLTWKQPYYIFARISDVTKDLSGTPRKRTSAPVVSTTSVSPYADLFVQLQIAPAVPVDLQPQTLSAWPILWQQIGADGSVVQEIHDVTDANGQAGITAGSGTNWTVTVAPKSWDGFSPLPGQGQTSNLNGQLIATNQGGGTYAAPRQVTVQYQNMLSVHGLVSLDVSGNQQQELGGAGLAGKVVYNDLNNNMRWDDGEPRTATDLGGFYDLRFPLPSAATTYTIRLSQDADTVGTLVRANPDSTSDFSFQAGASYTVAVDPTGTNPREAFDDRDFLLQKQFLLSGVVYQSGPNGQPYGPGAAPMAGVPVTLYDSTGEFTLATATTGPDGSYQLAAPGPGTYSVQAYLNQQDLVNVPGNVQFLTPDAGAGLPLTLNAPDGTPLQLNPDFQNAPASMPVTASGDFFGDGHWSVATLGTVGSGFNNPYDVYLVVLRGADSPAGVTTQVVDLGIKGLSDLLLGDSPSIFWSPGLKRLILATPTPQGGVIAHTYDPLTGATGTVALPANATGMSRLMAITSDRQTQTDTWLLASDSGDAWTLVQYASYAAAPTVLGSFSFAATPGTAPSGGLRPDTIGRNPFAPEESQFSGRWATMAQGDFDGDGVADYAFSSLNANGQQAVAYVLSRERVGGLFQQVHGLPLGDWQLLPSDDGEYMPSGPGRYIHSIQAVVLGTPGTNPRGLASLVIHRATQGNGVDVIWSEELLLYTPVPVGQALVAAGAPASTFAFASNFSLPQRGFNGGDLNFIPSVDMLADVNGDGRQDVVLLGSNHYQFTHHSNPDWGIGETVLIQQADGSLASPITKYYEVDFNGNLPGWFSGGLLSTGDTNNRGAKVPSLFNVVTGGGNGGGLLGQAMTLLHNTSYDFNNYVVSVDSPGSYGGYHFGFATGGTAAPAALSGTAYTDQNANGRQDPGEPNLANQRVQVTLRDAVGNVTNQVILTDAVGRYSVLGSAQVILSVNGLSPRNTQPAAVPPPQVGPLDAPVYAPSPTAGQGVPVGAGNLIQTLDYADTFTIGVGGRAGIQPNQGYPYPAPAVDVEYHDGQAPAQSWSPPDAWSFSVDAQAVNGTLPYPGGSGAGSATGFTQTGNTVDGGAYFALDYGLRDTYVVQADLVQTAGRVGIVSGASRGTNFAPGEDIAVFFYADNGPTPGVAISSSGQGATLVYATADGNDQGGSAKLLSGAKQDQWNNYAVQFDRASGTLGLYVNGTLLKQLDLRLFAGGQYLAYSNEAVIAGADGTDRIWLDNFQVGAPYDDYQVNSITAGQTGYDFGVKAATTPTGAIQGIVVVAQGADPWSPTNPPIAGLTLFLDLDGSGQLDAGEPQATTDTNGAYRFTGLTPGNYVVGQVLPAGVKLVSTTQAGGGVDVLAGQTAYAINFSDTQPAGTIQGFILGDGPDVTLFLDVNGSTNPDGQPQTTSNDGFYVFDDVPVGTYVVRQVLPSGITQVSTTQPSGGVGVLPGQSSWVNFTNNVESAQSVRTLYRTVLGRETDPEGLAAWGRVLEGGGSLAQVAEDLWESAEHRGRQVDRLYADYLGRAADAAGRAFWVSAMQGGMSETDVAQGILTSEEYRHHADTAAYLTGLYADVLGRTPDPNGLAYWQATAQAGTSPAALADSFLSSEEAARKAVGRYYDDFLDRASSVAEMSGWVGVLKSGLTLEEVALALLASDEFRNKAAR